ncbi:amino acid ABC transporter permease [Paralcaligenes sp. KSB-10]|uniref:amino acid ABC transporter permease n=1 Tax=Paralcaligenes sp. KSB-10 TaxID=2901142 RepID=UPI001E310045|nr:amino acid ABC transporter permease [Paralcaligenes sp. KSB-10]UHL62908.1 amino acid ABC transporter permease [Paralcaligenes sp. KSB-10]
MNRVVPLRRPWLWLGSAVVTVVLALLAVSVYRNPHIDHSVIMQYQFAPAILQGLRTTVVLAVLAAIIGLALGIVLAFMRLSASPVLRLGSGFYTWLLRGTPLLVQILLWGNLALLFQHIGPFDTNAIMTPFVASVVALGLNEAAYMAEIVRAGILSVDRGQYEASLALGMPRTLAMRRIILPQALRVIIPPAGNQFISLLKATSLVSVIAGGDLLTAAENISSANLHTIELMLVATFWYLVLTTITSASQYFIERRLGRAGTGLHGTR